MRLEIDIPEHHYNNIMALDSVNLGRVPYKGIIMYAINAIKHGKALEQEPTPKNDLGVDLISREDALDCVNMGISFCDVYKKINDLPSVTPQEPRKGYLFIDDVMSVFDDFMCGEVDEDGTETFLKMLKGKVVPCHYIKLAPTVDAIPRERIEQMIAEIEQMAEEEKIFDYRWALGLNHSVKIIRKYTKEQ